jgi:hypothetical protein
MSRPSMYLIDSYLLHLSSFTLIVSQLVNIFQMFYDYYILTSGKTYNHIGR